MDFLNDLRERIFGEDPEGRALGAIMKPVAPFDGTGSSLVAFGSLMALIVSVGVAIFSFAGLLVAMAAIYMIAAKVFGIQIDLREDFPF